MKKRTITICLPKRHDLGVKVLIGEWDDENNKGVAYSEIWSTNAFIPQRYTKPLLFDSYKTYLETVTDMYTQLLDEANKVEPSTYECDNTYLISAPDLGYDITVDSCGINIQEEGEEALVTVFASAPDLKIGQTRVVYVDVSPDACPMRAGMTVSLGYYCWRMRMNNVTIMNNNPLQFTCALKDLARQNSRMTRRTR